jgi:hypothetical protein
MAAKAILHTTVTLSEAPPGRISTVDHWREVEGPRQSVRCHAALGSYLDTAGCPDFLCAPLRPLR